VGPVEGSGRVLRGGGWNGSAANYRTAYRFTAPPTYRTYGSGFRLALGPSGKDTVASSKPISPETAIAADAGKYFYLTTKAMEEKGLVLGGKNGELEGHAVTIAIMTSTSAAPEQLWKPTLYRGEYFHLTTKSGEKDGLAMEGHNGKLPAFLMGKNSVIGQQFKTTPAPDGFFYLTTNLMEKEGKVLEGNDGRTASAKGGAAFMTEKSTSPGQLWKFVAVDE